MPEQTETRTIEWIGGVDGFVRLIDQTRLPGELVYRDCRTVEEVWEAIRSLRVRGAPAIGIAAAIKVLKLLFRRAAHLRFSCIDTEFRLTRGQEPWRRWNRWREWQRSRRGGHQLTPKK